MSPRQCGARTQIVEQELAVAENNAEEIVEVVRNAPREAPYCFHLLRLAQLFFGAA